MQQCTINYGRRCGVPERSIGTTANQFSNRLKWVAYKDMYFSSILIAGNEGFESTTIDSKMLPEDGYFPERV